MPLVDYKYNLFNIQPGQVFDIPYFLPTDYKDVILLEMGNAISDHTLDLTVEESQTTTINISKYQVVQVVLINPDTASVQLNLNIPYSEGIVLDSSVTMITLHNTTQYDSLFIKSTHGTAKLRLYLGLSNSRIGG